ncbi:hypothetical protein LKMONMHP_3494 [Methylobacterium organophilum]|uniref:Peptidoglycan binding-like domain-containing protein n=2 Tax=Methylobacterium organophilum TaxID=410 RepID=A0ABQ4TAB6_METOR|nr:peptidoglycan-binding domain-containing protein [Methylobacterium organophilum]UMY19982.1 peptidoglycan-binding protein [Methylobacterium organophilum]GJE28621.1 hypothetical protein LKMONMHP_3494 [Methylobacterium organophilum]
MREPTPRRDQRDIVVPGDMRASRPAAGKPPGRRPLPRTQAAGASGGMLAFAAKLGRIGIAHPGETLGTLAALAAAAYVALNALGFQVGRHPAPILPQAVAKAEPKKAAPPPAKAAPEEPAAVKAAEPPRPKEAAEAAKPVPHDAIGEIIKTRPETTASVTPKADPAVARAQRALVKLGYGPLKEDGLMGPGTRAAIEKFERDRKLAVTGQPAGKTLRELAAKAGLPQG